jgi:hypothetical protein
MTVLHEWDEHTAETLTHAAFDGGWGRLNSVASGLLNAVAVRLRPCTLSELTAVLITPQDGAAAWDEECWIEDDDPAEHARRIAAVDAYAAHVGLSPVRTCRDVLALLVAAGALYRDGDTVYPVLPVPRVDDVFPVSDEERQDLAAMRGMYDRMDSVA